MPRLSAGLVLFRRISGRLEVFLVHPGGPFWAKKDAGAWSIPKGEYSPGVDPLAAARREFSEETGLELPPGEPIPLGELRQAGGKLVTAWAIECGTADNIVAESIHSNTFSMEWPPRSGKLAEFPEVDRAAWFPLDTAQEKILASQQELLSRLARSLNP